VFDQLIYSDADGKLSPSLATAWIVAGDRKSVTLTLRSDVKFHDGTPFDANAVKFTFDSIVDPKTASQSAIDIIGPYDHAEVTSPNTIRIFYKRAFAGILDSLADVRASIVSPSAVSKLGNTGFAQAPVGTGAFRFVSWARGREVILERNNNYAW